METKCIYKAMASIMKDVKAIGKTEKNAQQNFKYRGIDNVMNELHDVFAKHSVFIVPDVASYDVREKMTGKGALMYVTHVSVRFHFISGEDGSEVVSAMVGEAMDMADKSMNKAMSIALKYALMQMLLIPTEDQKDPDAVTTEPTRNMTTFDLLRQQPDSSSELGGLLAYLAGCKSIDDVSNLFRTNVEYQAEHYRKYFTMRKNEINRGLIHPQAQQ